MGVVPSYGEIEADRVPEVGVFNVAKDIFIEETAKKVAQGYFDGSYLYGSVAVGTHGRRSDFDGLIALNDGKTENYHAAREVSLAIMQGTDGKVPLEIYAYSKSDLKGGFTTIDRFFGTTHTGTERIVIGNDPAEYIKFCGSDVSAKDIFASYLFSKRFRLDGAYLQTDELDTSEGGLQRMLELPNAIGRKALQALSEASLDIPTVKGVDKSAIYNESLKLFERYGVGAGFESLAGANKGFSQLLAQAIEGRIDRQEYEDIIRQLHATLPFAIEWIGQVQDKILPLFDKPTK